MAIIRFDPTWVTSVKRFPNPEYRNGYPIESGTNYDSWRAYVGFDFSEINRILNMFTVNGKYLKTKASITVGVSLHSNLTAPSEIYPPLMDSGAGEPIGSFEGDYYKLNLDQSLAYAGPSGPVYVTFQGAINLGYQGFVLDPEWNESLITDEVFIELEGNFDNPRPTPTSPVGGSTLNRNETIRFTWNHNSPFSQVRFELRYRVKGASTWINVQADTNNGYYDLPASTLLTNEYEWQVRTTSEYGFLSPWSLTQVFNAAETTPSPVFVNPTNGGTVEISDLNVEWTSVDQHQYEFELRDNNNNIIWSDAKISTNKTISKANILENGKSYRLRLRVNQQGNFFSPWVQITINVDYTQPARPILNIISDQENARLNIMINNPPPTGTEPKTTHQELFKRELGGDWIKLANLLTDSEYIDYAVASDQRYEYRVVAHGNNDTSITSNVFRGSVTFKEDILNIANEPATFVKLIMNPQRSFAKNFSSTKKIFAGRKLPTVEFGETTELGLSLSYLVDEADMIILNEIVSSQKTLIYRDPRGRKHYIAIESMSVTDEIKYPDFYVVNLSITEVFYKEGID